jgi:hypothetical protein
MHAPVVLQHCLLSKYSKSRREILDMAKYIREYFDRQELFNHIFLDEGIPSNSLMSMILDHTTTIKIVELDLIDAAYLRQSGPVLMSDFPLCDDFALDDGHLVYDLSDCDAAAHHARPPPISCVNRGGWQNRKVYTDEDTGRCTRYHAMLIVGVRTESGSRRFCDGGIKLKRDASTCRLTVTRICPLHAIKIQDNPEMFWNF